MRAFEVKKATESFVLKDGQPWESVQRHTCKEDNMFFLEDVAVDPLGIQGPALGGVCIGSHLADQGFYGFRKDGWLIFVHSNSVVVH